MAVDVVNAHDRWATEQRAVDERLRRLAFWRRVVTAIMAAITAHYVARTATSGCVVAFDRWCAGIATALFCATGVLLHFEVRLAARGVELSRLEGQRLCDEIRNRTWRINPGDEADAEAADDARKDG